MSEISGPIELSPHLYVLLSEFPHRSTANVYLITGAVPTLIDCGSRDAFPSLARNLSRVGLEPSDIAQVIATHGHYDHIQGLHALRAMNPTVPLRIHENDLAMIQGHDAYRTAASVYHREFEPIPAAHLHALRDGQIVPAGDTSLTVLHTPGHTPGSICLLGKIDGTKVLFSGDTIFGAMNGLQGADLAIWTQAITRWKASLDRLAGIDFDVFLPGHEPMTGLPIPKERFLRKLPYFGRMLNPWFSLDEEPPTTSDQGEPAASGPKEHAPASPWWYY